MLLHNNLAESVLCRLLKVIWGKTTGISKITDTVEHTFKGINAPSNTQPLTLWHFLQCVGRLTRQETEAKANINRCPPKPDYTEAGHRLCECQLVGGEEKS